MKIIDHILDSCKKDLILLTKTPMKTRRFLVIHFTSGYTASSSRDGWREERKASAHFTIERDGTIVQVVPCNIQAWHAGKSNWTDPNTGIRYDQLNTCSIGIELANCGNFDDGLSVNKAMKIIGFAGTKRAKHRLDNEEKTWEIYPEQQLIACFQLAKLLVKTYNLDDIVGHDQIAPDRKRDPGPLFSMATIKNFCGLK